MSKFQGYCSFQPILRLTSSEESKIVLSCEKLRLGFIYALPIAGTSANCSKGVSSPGRGKTSGRGQESISFKLILFAPDRLNAIISHRNWKQEYGSEGYCRRNPLGIRYD